MRFQKHPGTIATCGWDCTALLYLLLFVLALLAPLSRCFLLFSPLSRWHGFIIAASVHAPRTDRAQTTGHRPGKGAGRTSSETSERLPSRSRSCSSRMSAGMVSLMSCSIESQPIEFSICGGGLAGQSEVLARWRVWEVAAASARAGGRAAAAGCTFMTSSSLGPLWRSSNCSRSSNTALKLLGVLVSMRAARPAPAKRGGARKADAPKPRAAAVRWARRDTAIVGERAGERALRSRNCDGKGESVEAEVACCVGMNIIGMIV